MTTRSRSRYVPPTTPDGRSLAAPVIRYDKLMAGATLEFVMGPRPSHWASDWRPGDADH